MKVPVSRGAAAQTAAEHLIAAMQDGGKIIYLRHAATSSQQKRTPSTSGFSRAQTLGWALRMLRVPLNNVVTSPASTAIETADLAFGKNQFTVSVDLGAYDVNAQRPANLDGTRSLFHMPPPGENRVLIGDRPRLEAAAGRRFSDDELPEQAMAVFLPGSEPAFLGIVTAERVIASAKARGAIP